MHTTDDAVGVGVLDVSENSVGVGDNFVGVGVETGATTAYDAVGVGVHFRVGVDAAGSVRVIAYVVVGSVDGMTAVSGALHIGARRVVRPEDDCAEPPAPAGLHVGAPCSFPLPGVNDNKRQGIRHHGSCKEYGACQLRVYEGSASCLRAIGAGLGWSDGFKPR